MLDVFERQSVMSGHGDGHRHLVTRALVRRIKAVATFVQMIIAELCLHFSDGFVYYLGHRPVLGSIQ